MISNIKKYIGVTILLLLFTGPAVYQGILIGETGPYRGKAFAAEVEKKQQAPLRADTTDKEGPKQYISAGVVLVVWVGIAFFLFTIDRRVSRLEKDCREDESI